MASIEQNIAQQAIRAGVQIPDRILNAPTLLQGLDLYLQAFFDLDTDRSHATGLTRIPWSSIKNYAEFYDFSLEQCEDLFYFIKAMDLAHLKRLDEKKG